MNELELKRIMNERYEDAVSLWQQWWSEADKDLRMSVGDQTYYNSLFPLSNANGPKQRLYFNKIRRVINMVTGYQRKNRLTSVVNPIENADEETSTDLTGVLMWAMRRSDVFNTISDAFEGALQTGLNLLNVWMDYRQDPENGEICCDRLPYNSTIMDPYFTKHDFSDCGWIWKRNWLTREQCAALLPEQKREILRMSKQDGKDGKFNFMPQQQQYGSSKLFSYDEYWTREYRKTKVLLDKETGDTLEWNGQEDEFHYLRQIHPEFEMITLQKPTVRQHILVNGNLVYDEQRPYNSDLFPFIPVFCYIQPEVTLFSWKIQGIVRNLRDSQIELNRRREKMLDILDSVVNSGWKAKEDALVNAEDAFLTGQGRVMFLKKSAQMTDVQEIIPPQIPPSMFEMQSILDKEINEISGISEELLGAQDDNVAGVLSMLRQGAGLVSLQTVFDRLNLSQKVLSDVYLDYIQNNFSYGKAARILGRNPTDAFKSADFQKYDCAVEPGLLTATQKQMEFAQLMQMREMQIPIPTKALIDASTLQNKKKLMDDMEQESQGQQQAMQMQMMQQQAAIESLQAKTTSDYALAHERSARAVADIGLAKERVSQSVHDRAKAALDNAKAIQEIEHLDRESLIKVGEFLLNLTRSQTAQNEAEYEGVKQEAEEQQPQTA